MIEKEWRSDLILKLLSKEKDKSSFDAQQDLALKTKGSYKLNLEQASKDPRDAIAETYRIGTPKNC